MSLYRRKRKIVSHLINDDCLMIVRVNGRRDILIMIQ